MQLKYKYFTSQRSRCCLAAPRWFQLWRSITDADACEGQHCRGGNGNVAKEAQKKLLGGKREETFLGHLL